MTMRRILRVNSLRPKAAETSRTETGVKACLRARTSQSPDVAFSSNTVGD